MINLADHLAARTDRFIESLRTGGRGRQGIVASNNNDDDPDNDFRFAAARTLQVKIRQILLVQANAPEVTENFNSFAVSLCVNDHLQGRTLPLRCDGTRRLLPEDARGDDGGQRVLTINVRPGDNVTLLVHASYRPLASARIRGPPDMSPVAVLPLPISDVRRSVPRPFVCADNISSTLSQRSLRPPFRQMRFVDRSESELFDDLHAKLRFPVIREKRGFYEETEASCNAKFSLRATFAERPHNGSMGEIAACVPLLGGRLVHMRLMEGRQLPFNILRAIDEYPRNVREMQGVAERRFCVTLKNIGSADNAMGTSTHVVSGPGAANAFLEDPCATLDLAVYVESPHDEVCLFVHEADPEETGEIQILATASVPFWDERFSAGLGVDLFLENARSSHEAFEFEMPIHVQCTLAVWNMQTRP